METSPSIEFGVDPKGVIGMTLEDKQRLLELLAETHAVTRSKLEGIDLELRVYPDSGWRIRDIIGHIATWDRQVVKSLDAYRLGKEYAIPNLDEANFNEQTVLAQQEMTAQQIFKEWEQAREDFTRAVEEIPLDQFLGDLLYPWGDERGTIAYLVKMMTDHDTEHRVEIVKALELGT
jgi:hypothetical protein